MKREGERVSECGEGSKGKNACERARENVQREGERVVYACARERESVRVRERKSENEREILNS